MSNYTEEKIGCGLVIFLIICGIFIISLIGGFIFTKSDVLVKETPEYLYYKQYDLYNTDSVIHKFHKPIHYNGVVSNITRSQHVVGLLGKGGHWNSDFDITISYDNKTYTYRDEIFGLVYVHHTYNKGDKVKVVETFYPRYEINIYKK